MGSYILSLSPMAKHPYRTRELGVDIYTAEELCYYIYHNFVVVDDEFISRELFEFLEDELKLVDHVAHIRKYIEDKPSMELTLLFILREFRFYNETELHEFQIRYEEFKRNGTAMRRLLKADFLLEHGYVLGALNMYHYFDYAKKDLTLQPDFIFKVRQHMAVAYIRLGLNTEAMEAFKSAWQEQQNEEILKQIYRFSLFSGVPMPQEIAQALDAVKEQQWRAEFEEAKTQAYLLASTGSTAAIFTKDAVRRKELLDEYIGRKKKEYRKAIL
ncbi:MAG: hypothetical protein IK125_07530 [Lachnospiraceae bacterium]|nr:hypothetical protein [Lachnospiraceae bacterium]